MKTTAIKIKMYRLHSIATFSQIELSHARVQSSTVQGFSPIGEDRDPRSLF